jgi:UDP-4-amino-4,6-dideoxy-N-acetyl-beta-L-altrosamine N-acetyltransferase
MENETKNSILRRLNKNDKEILYKWINNRELRKYSSSYQQISWDEHCTWFDNIQKDKTTEIFGVKRNPENNDLVGTCQLTNIQQNHKRAELLIRVWEPELGYGTTAIKELVDYAFFCLQLHKIYLHVFAWNARAIHVYEKCGFKKEGFLKDDVIVDGKYTDQYIMAKINNLD